MGPVFLVPLSNFLRLANFLTSSCASWGLYPSYPIWPKPLFLTQRQNYDEKSSYGPSWLPQTSFSPSYNSANLASFARLGHVSVDDDRRSDDDPRPNFIEIFNCHANTSVRCASTELGVKLRPVNSHALPTRN